MGSGGRGYKAYAEDGRDGVYSCVMDEAFFIPVVYKHAPMEFEASLVQSRYAHAFHVKVGEVIVVFEKDEEGQYRARIPTEETGKVPDRELVQAIGEAIEEILK